MLWIRPICLHSYWWRAPYITPPYYKCKTIMNECDTSYINIVFSFFAAVVPLFFCIYSFYKVFSFVHLSCISFCTSFLLINAGLCMIFNACLSCAFFSFPYLFFPAKKFHFLFFSCFSFPYHCLHLMVLLLLPVFVVPWTCLSFP